MDLGLLGALLSALGILIAVWFNYNSLNRKLTSVIEIQNRVLNREQAR